MLILKETMHVLFKRTNRPLFFILILAILLRLMGTNPGYDHPHPDEPTITDLAKRITLDLNFKPHAYYYGSLLPIIYSATNGVLLTPNYLHFLVENRYLYLTSLKNPGSSSEEKISVLWRTYVKNIKHFEYWTRYETAVLSSFTVVAIYFLGKRLFSKRVGLIAAFLVAINYRHVLSSHFALADAPVALFATISILLSTILLKDRSLKSYILAGIGLALSFSVKYFIYTIPAFLVCHIIAWYQPTLKKYTVNFKNKNFYIKPVMALILAVFLFFLINPYLILDNKEATFQLEYNSVRYGFTGAVSDFIKPVTWYPIYYLFKIGMGEILSILALIGILIGILKYKVQTLILLSTLVPFFYFFLVLSGSTHGRTYSAVIPLLLLFSALPIANIVNFLLAKSGLKNNFLVNLGTAVFIGLLTLPMLKSTFQTSLSLHSHSNKEKVINWLANYLPPNEKLVQYWGVPIPSTIKNELIFLGPIENDFLSVQEFQEGNISYVAMGTDAGSSINGVFWMENDPLVKKVMLNDGLLRIVLEEKYASLITREMGYYRITEFSKPSEYSLDPAYFIAKIPNFDTQTLQLENDYANTDWTTFSYDKSPFYEIQTQDSNLLFASKDELCIVPFTKFISPKIPVTQNKFYVLSALSENIQIDKATDNGFLRLDFLSADGKILKSHVSKQMISTDKTELKVFGPTPRGATHLQTIIQFNNCLKGKYIISELKLFSKDTGFEQNKWPYYDSPLQFNFIWLPHL